MYRLTSLAALLLAASFSQGCATSHSATPSTAAAAVPATAPTQPGTTPSAVASARGPQSALEVERVAHRTEVPVEKNAPDVQGHPLTSVVVTQCNLIVAVYMTMQDGRLMRFDKTANVPAEQLLEMAYSATRSERVEVDCNQNAGAVGYERHDPV
jgi:hypothetical protein